MTKKYWLQVIVCICIILIGTVLGIYYYQEYIAPESYTIGSITAGTYKELEIKDYLSDDTVLFSQNINDVSFKIDNGTATYDYNFDPKDFNGLENNYLIYVNNYIINDLTTNAGTISGVYNLNYFDINNDSLCDSNITISFTFRSLSSVLRVSLPENDIGYLMNYFKTDNFIITLAISPFTFGDKEGEVDEKVNQIIELSNEVNSLSNQITVLNSKIAKYIQDIADLTVSDEDKTEQILELQENISSLQTQITTLTNKLTEKSNQLETIQTENADLLEENSSLSALVTNQQQTITALNQTITQLQNQVTYYEQLLEVYQDSEKLIVTYTVDGSAYEVQLVAENGYATEPQTDPIKEGYVFEFWSLDGSTAFNFESTPITSNTTLIAVFNLSFAGTYQLSYTGPGLTTEENCIFTITDESGELIVNLISSERVDSFVYSSEVVFAIDDNKITYTYHALSFPGTAHTTETIIEITLNYDTGDLGLFTNNEISDLSLIKIDN